MPSAISETGLSVVEHFAGLRGRILDILASVEAALEETGHRPHEIAPSLKRARERISEDTLQLSIVGAEGHGKSTLLNALMGPPLGKIVPADPDRPATVAPVELRWAETASPKYAVHLQGPQIEAKPCADADEFSQYMLQRFNTGNRRRVARGVIHLKHTYLARGLTVVDMPGIDGVDEDIRAQVSADLHRYTNAVVAVTRDRRGHGAIASIFRDYKVNPRRALAVVNVDAEYMETERAAKDGTSVAEIIEAKRKGFVEMLAATDVAISPERVFVVCLPLMEAGTQKGDVDLAHAREVERLRAAVWSEVEHQSLETVVHDSIDLALEAISAADSHLHTLAAVVNAATGGADVNTDLETALGQALDQARHIAADGLFDPARLDRQIEEGWHQHLSAPIRLSGQGAARFLSQKIAGVEGLADVSATDAAAIRKEIELFSRDASAPLDLARNEGLWAFIEDLCSQANRIITHVYSAGPELQALGRAGHRVHVTAETLPYLRLSRTRPDLFAYAWKVGVPVGSGLVAASLGTALTVVGAVSNPMVALPVLFVLGGGAGWYAASRALGGRKGELVRFLNERLRTLDDMNGEAKGPLFDQWRFVCLKVAHLVQLNLDEALTSIGRLLRTGDQSLSDLARQQTQIAAARKRIGEEGAALRRMMVEGRSEEGGVSCGNG